MRFFHFLNIHFTSRGKANVVRLIFDLDELSWSPSSCSLALARELEEYQEARWSANASYGRQRGGADIVTTNSRLRPERSTPTYETNININKEEVWCFLFLKSRSSEHFRVGLTPQAIGKLLCLESTVIADGSHLMRRLFGVIQRKITDSGGGLEVSNGPGPEESAR